MAANELAPVTGIVLAGGLARRFRGEDKGLIELAGRPLAGWVADGLRGRVAEIVVSANRNLPGYARLGHTVVPDRLPDYPGPLAGLLSAAATAQQAADETGTHYAIMLAHRDLMDDLRDYVDEGGRRVQAWQQRHACETVYFGDDAYAFLNVNTPEDLRTAERVAHRYPR